MKEAYIHLIAVRAEDKDDERMQKLLSLYQSDDTAAFIEKEYEGSLIPVFLRAAFSLKRKNDFLFGRSFFFSAAHLIAP